MPSRYFVPKALAVSAISLFMAGQSIDARAFDMGSIAADLTHPSVSAVLEDDHNILKHVSDENGAGSGAQKFIDNMADQALGFIANENMSKDQKAAKFKTLLESSFDMNTIARFALGRYWRTATNEQKKEYLRLFKDMVVSVYSGRFDEYEGQKFETRSSRNDGDKDALVSSFVVPDKGSEIQIDWRVRHKNGKYQIVDVVVEGVSMSVTQRSDFASVIQRGGGNVDVLLEHLRTQSSGE
jgi:phospholipid transport system substrate-binding protein